MTPARSTAADAAGARAAVPWWVLPAIVLSAFAGALMARWLDFRPEAPPAPATVAAAAPVQAAVAVVTASAPPAAAPPVQLRVSGVLVVDGRPALALVSVDRAAAQLMRVGDRLSAQATVLAIEPAALVYREAGVDKRVEVTPGPTPPVALSPAPALPPLQAAAPADAAAPGGEAPGSGNAAFRAAIEEKLRAARR